MKHLIPMTDFVLEQDEKESLGGTYDRIVRYAKFLKRPLKLGMFMPCDEEGNIFEEPKLCCSGRECGCMGMPYNYSSHEELEEYYEAEERVLFEGFEVCTCNSELSVRKKNRLPLMKSEMENMTVEDLVKGNLILTPIAIKQIGL